MNINLNDSSFDGKTGAIVFNNGKAGIAENVIMSIEKKKADDKEGSPDYKLIFTDEKGGVCSSSFWYITKDTAYKTVEEQVQAQGKIMKHLLHLTYGSDFEIPSFSSTQEMLDNCMKLIKQGLPTLGKVRIFANYGVKIAVKKWIQPRSWVPFVESMSVPLEDTRLQVSDLDALERLTETTFSAVPSGDTLLDDNDDWD